MVRVLERDAGASCHCAQRVFCNVERNVDLLGEPLCHTSEQGASSGEENAVLNYVRVQLRRGLLQHVQDGRLYLGHGLVKAVGDFLIGDGRLHRVRCHEVLSPDDNRLRLVLQVGDDGTHGNLDTLRGYLSHLDVVLLLEVVLDVRREDVARRTDAVLDHDAAEGDDGDLRRTAADVDDHVALRGFDLEADTEGGRHRLIDEVDLTRAGVLGGVADGPDLDFGTAGGDAYDDLEVGGEKVFTQYRIS